MRSRPAAKAVIILRRYGTAEAVSHKNSEVRIQVLRPAFVDWMRKEREIPRFARNVSRTFLADNLIYFFVRSLSRPFNSDMNSFTSLKSR